MLERFARAAFLSWNRGDYALVPIIDHPEVEAHFTVRDQMAVGTDDVYYGPHGHCRAMQEWNEAWREWDAEIDEVIEEGRDRVLVVARLYGEGAASGITLDDWGAVRYTFREGRILHRWGDRCREGPRAQRARYDRSGPAARVGQLLARYCASDVAGERGGGAEPSRSLEPTRQGRV